MQDTSSQGKPSASTIVPQLIVSVKQHATPSHQSSYAGFASQWGTDGPLSGQDTDHTELRVVQILNETILYALSFGLYNISSDLTVLTWPTLHEYLFLNLHRRPALPNVFASSAVQEFVSLLVSSLMMIT